jgi:transaldolase
MVKIPATAAGVDAIAAATAEGHNINATLIFSTDRYEEVLEAYTAGLQVARSRDLDISAIHSVASLFVSRIDAALAIHQRHTPGLADDPSMSSSSDAPSKTGHTVIGAGRQSCSPFALAGVANARAAHARFRTTMETGTWQRLREAGANPQRLLWASTGVKDPRLNPTTYIQGLAVPGTVFTLPLPTLLSATKTPARNFRDGSAPRDAADLAEASATLADVGEPVMSALLDDGVATFGKSWAAALETVEMSMCGHRR